MARSLPSKRQKSEGPAVEEDGRPASAVRRRDSRKPSSCLESLVHVLGPGIICTTDRRGHPTPHGKNPAELVLDASEGFIPLWDSDTVLRWRFQEQSMDYFEDPAAAKTYIRNLLTDALLAWGSAAPVTFKYDEDLWDFEIVMHSSDECNGVGCVLAAAFFPDGGRHELELFPKMFTQPRKEQVDTLIHELGHVFGLRHFFAQVSETQWPSEIFGRHDKFTIMNYGALSELTDADREDLTQLYQSVWSGELTHINGTPIRLVKPYSSLAPVPDVASAIAQVPPALRPRIAPLRSRTTRPRSPSVQSRSSAAYLDEQ